MSVITDTLLMLMKTWPQLQGIETKLGNNRKKLFIKIMISLLGTLVFFDTAKYLVKKPFYNPVKNLTSIPSLTLNSPAPSISLLQWL